MKRRKKQFAVEVKTTKVVRQIVDAKTTSEAEEKAGLGAGRVAGSSMRVTFGKAQRVPRRH